jgi:acetate kinase
VRLLVVNAGSSSLKLRVLDADDATLAERSLEWPRGSTFPAGALDELPAVEAVAHRVVHGGDAFRAAVWLDDDVRGRLAALTDLAPLHQPRALAAIDAVGHERRDLPAAACFDTAFHATLPAAAATYALPAEWPRHRFGFHGLSHAYAARRGAELDGRPLSELRVVTCHLGAGASLAAVAAGQSVDTTMGFTPLDGLVMATRAGSVDPGLLLWLIEHRDVSPTELGDALEHRSGLAALSDTSDMQEILERSDETSQLALDT